MGDILGINRYCFFTMVYISIAIITFLPVIYAMIWGKKMHPGGDSFNESPHFSEGGKRQLIQHFSRIQGTLLFWKRKATTYMRFHYYCISWTLFSAWLIPLLSVTISQDPGGKWLILAVSSHVALALGFYRGFNILENMRAFRLGESAFYDLYRRLLDDPLSLGKTEKQQLYEYFRRVEIIRREIRNAEAFNIPSVSDISEKIACKDSFINNNEE